MGRYCRAATVVASRYGGPFNAVIVGASLQTFHGRGVTLQTSL